MIGPYKYLTSQSNRLLAQRIFQCASSLQSSYVSERREWSNVRADDRRRQGGWSNERGFDHGRPQQRYEQRQSGGYNVRPQQRYEQRQGGWSNISGYNGRPNRSSFSAGGNLRGINWDDFDLKAVNKDVYKEHASVKSRDINEVKQWLKENEIKLKGDNIPTPIFKIEEANFPEAIEEMLVRDYKGPTDIQSITWPVALSGLDLISIAKTGSGKTLGFILPGIVHTISQGKRINNEGPSVLVMLPTRELAKQVEEVAIPYCRKMGLKTVCLYGGVSKLPQSQALDRGVDICIATPGRLLDLLEEGVIDLKRCSYIVFDEADRMLDMGFEPQIRKVISQIRPDKQSLMFSATWPKEIRQLAGDFLNNPVHLQSGSSELTSNKNITQHVKIVDETEKPQLLLEILEDVKKESAYKTLIFVATKLRADVLSRKLYQRRFNASALHGDKSQTERDRIMEEFRRNSNAILIATDVAARGIDVTDIKYVINYDYPNNSTDYIHRIGRTGRCNNKGTSYTFMSPDQGKLVPDLITVLKNADQEIPKELEKLNW